MDCIVREKESVKAGGNVLNASSFVCPCEDSIRGRDVHKVIVSDEIFEAFTVTVEPNSASLFLCHGSYYVEVVAPDP